MRVSGRPVKLLGGRAKPRGGLLPLPPLLLLPKTRAMCKEARSTWYLGQKEEVGRV